MSYLTVGDGVLIPVSSELLRLGELLRLMSISRLRAAAKGTPLEYERTCARFVAIVRQYDAEAARIGAPPHYQAPVVPTEAW